MHNRGIREEEDNARAYIIHEYLFRNNAISTKYIIT